MVFASGTPVTNTMGELYTVMRFFAADELERAGIATFDAWSRQFGDSVAALEANAAGRYEVVERFARFENVPELMSRVRQFMDVLTSEHLGALVKRPEIEGGKPQLVAVEPTAALKAYMKEVLVPRLERSRRWKPTRQEPFNPDPVIAITSDGRFAALDPRFFGAAVDESTPTKLTVMADAIAAEYQASAGNVYVDKDGRDETVPGGTQIVFYNLGFGAQSQRNRGFNARGALTRRLVDKGVKREHIAWFDDADTHAKKEAIFKAMRAGQLRVLIGSAKKMGTGVNVQKRLTALHYFDPPWYPSDVEQPHGRIIRQGNQNPRVRIQWYATKGTYDATMWQMVGRKQRFIDQAFTGDKTLRSMEDVSEASQYEQAAAVASGDPRALQLAGLRQEVERLERLHAAHTNEQINVRNALSQAEWGVTSAVQREKSYAAAFKAAGERHMVFTAGTVGRATFDKAGEFGQALKDAFNERAAEHALDPTAKPIDLAKLGDLPIRMHPDFERADRPTGKFELVVHVGSHDVLVLDGARLGTEVDAVGLTRRIVNRIHDIDTSLRNAREDRVRHETDVRRLRRKAGAPFEHQQELLQAVADLRRLEEELRSEGEADTAAATTVVVDADGELGQGALAADPPVLSRAPGFSAAVDAALADGADLRVHVPLGRTPALLKWLGVPDKPVVTMAALLDKMHQMHGLTAAQLKTLPDLLADPVMVFRSDTRDGRFLVVTDLVSNGRPVVLVVDPEGKAGRVEVVFVPSAYPKDDLSAFARWIKAGLLEYVHKSRSRQLATTTGLQLPGVVQRAVGFNVKKYKTDADRPPGENLASRGQAPGTRAADIERAIRPIVNAWTDGPTSVTVVQSVSDLPPDVQEGLKAVDAEGVARAFLNPETGRVFLIADNLADVADAQFALFHEVYGHFGLRAVLGDEYLPMMTRLRSGNTRLAAEAAHWFALYGPQEVAARVDAGMPRMQAERLVRALAVEEALADRAGMNEPVSFLRLLLGRIQRALRRLGLDQVANWLENHTEAETLELLRRARRAVQGADGQGHALRVDPREADDTPLLSRSSPLDALRRIDQQAIRDSIADHLGDAGGHASWWDKTLGTQYAKAQKYARNPATAGFKTVFDAVQSYLEGVSTLANESADQAPGILPPLDTWRDLARRGLSDTDAQAVAAPIFEGTLVDKKVYNEDELRGRFGLTPAQIEQYRAFLAAVNTSLDQAVAADVLRLVGDDAPAAFKRLAMSERAALRREVDDLLTRRIDQATPEARDELERLLAQVREKYARIDTLKHEGYAPLMRFGEFAVTVRDPATQEVLYFGLFENRAAANRMARELGQDVTFQQRGAVVEQGVLSQEQFKLFAGVPVESLEMFAAAIGADKAEVYQQFLKLTKNNRSALKRLIHRKGTAGFSQDVPRVLAAFVTSNARLASAALNLPGASQAAEGIRAGDVKDEAVGLIETATNPRETASVLRGLLFMNFIGGSIASAFVNLTQPLTMTAPYLSQWGGMGRAAARLLAAGKMAASGKVADVELRNALAKAERDGIVSPQEIHHLTAQAMGTWGTNPVLKKAAFIWGSGFSLAEQFNRRVTFLAAYQTAKAEGIDDPFGFAERAVTETQGLYNRGNAPNWARNPVGAVALTFKQFSIHYVEWLTRMWQHGPAGRRAVAWALVVLLAAAGADGLPFAEDLDDLIDTLAQALGLDFSSARAKREFVARTLGLGDDAADAFTRGLSSIPGMPIDLSLRLSMGNLVPASGLFLRSNTDRSRDVMELAGAAGSAARQGIEAGEKALQGDVAGSLRSLAPVAVQNALKGVQVWSTGEYRDTRGRKVMEADALDGLMKAMGFQPAAVARESRGIALEQRRVQLARNVEAEIADAWARGLVDEDPEAVRAAQERLAQWNADNPRSRIVVQRTQIARRARELRAGRSERFVRSAPRELRAEVERALP
jgi:hypothetical protein